MREVVFIPLLSLSLFFFNMSYLSVRALRRLAVLMLEEEEREHLQTQWSLTILYLRSSSSRSFC